MDLVISLLAAIGGMSGWGLFAHRIHRDRNRLASRLAEIEAKTRKQSDALEANEARCRTLARRYRRQLEQARLYFAIEEAFASRLAEATGSSSRTCKSEVRRLVEQRTGDVVTANATTPSGIRKRIEELDEFESTWSLESADRPRGPGARSVPGLESTDPDEIEDLSDLQVLNAPRHVAIT